MNGIIRIGAPLIAVSSSPVAVYANAGTPIMWAGALHLFVGNFAIGIAEGLILAFLFRRKALLCVAVMIAANYFSAWVGSYLISWITPSLDLDLYNAWRWLWSTVVVSYLGTIVLEWPFVALCLRKCPGWLLKSIWGSLVVQSASYLVIFGWYWSASETWLYAEMAIVPPSEITVPKDWLLYYISEADGDVYVLGLNHGTPKKICELGSSPSNRTGVLCVTKSQTKADRYDLVARREGQDWQHPILKTVLPEFASVAVPSRTDEHGLPYPYGKPFQRLEVPGLSETEKSGWTFRSEPGEWGMRLENAKDGRTLDVSLETPFVVWGVHRATQLPSGQVVFQLGPKQICILDPDQRKIALLVKGHSPVVALK